MTQTPTSTAKPEILAPAGDMPAALAALAAGADAVYLGLKHFSARMQAENFSTGELAGLVDLAHAKGRRVYVTMNTLLKAGEPGQALRLMRRLAVNVKPDALIVQDPAMAELARQADFQGELHFSTLANVTHPKALAVAKAMGAKRVIVPRELSLDELRLMNDACPEDLDLELFVHGALCFCVSGRCWWSSYMGGKSGLRGRCVQPCRRVYTQKGREGRFFSCLDLSLDTLARQLLPLERLRSWKIEGRKKGPHYVWHVTTAYRLLRDEGPEASPLARREVERLIGMAFGRPGTRSLFVPGDGPTGPQSGGKELQTGSGLLCGRVGKNESGQYLIQPRIALLPKDYLRVGHEDEVWHCTLSVPGKVAEGAAFTLSLPRGKHPKAGTPVYLIDRKDAAVEALLASWVKDLQEHAKRVRKADEDVSALIPQSPRMPSPPRGKSPVKKLILLLRSSLPHGRDAKKGIAPGTVQGLWLSPKALREISRTLFGRVSWWLPPVIWPDEEERWEKLVVTALRGGARHFVCNAPWQLAFFDRRDGLSLTAGPFCNIANAPALGVLAKAGFAAAIVSPELGEDDILTLPRQSPLPLGIVLDGFWPMGISRHQAAPLKTQESFHSPKGEEFWMRRYGQNTWIYPAWPLDLAARRQVLEQAGYATFVHMDDYPPKGLAQQKRESEFNWKVDVL